MTVRRDELAMTRAVADAADAWLRDPRDANVYARLVRAVEDLRAYRAGRLTRYVITSDSDAEEPPQPDEVLDGLADQAPVAAIGDLLAGAPDDVLHRLRRAALGPSAGRDPDAGGEAAAP